MGGGEGIGATMGGSGSGMGGSGIGATGGSLMGGMGGGIGGGGIGGGGIGCAMGGSPGWAMGGSVLRQPMSAAPPSAITSTPMAGRTSAGPEGGGVGRTVLREPTAYFGGPHRSLSTHVRRRVALLRPPTPQPLDISKIFGGRGSPSK